MKRIGMLVTTLAIALIMSIAPWNTSLANESSKLRIVDIASGEYLAAAVFSDGKASLVGVSIAEFGKEKLPSFRNDVETWEDIIKIAVGDSHVVGLKKDGTVVASGSNTNGQCNVESWRDVVAIDAGHDVTTAITKNGTLLSAGTISEITFSGGSLESKNIEQNVSGITNVKNISAGSTGTVVLHHNGQCSTIGTNLDGAFNGVNTWDNIVDVAYYSAHTLALRADGTVLSAGVKGGDGRRNVGNWKNIVQVDCGKMHSVGLKNDGTVVATGRGNACKVQTWENIIKVCAGGNNTMGLTADGTIVYCGSWGSIKFSESDLDAWNARVNLQ